MPPVSRLVRLASVLLLVVTAATPCAQALLNIDGSRNQVFVFGSVQFGYNSNIFSEAAGRGDYSITSQAGLELKRRAGIIAVNASTKVDYIVFGTYSDQNSINPNLSVELDKTTGRTTGTFTMNAYRETRSDSAVNLRTSSWNFPLNLNLKYPINDKLYVTSGTGYLSRSYSDSLVLVDYTDYSEAIDVYYVYTSKLDLLGGYRLRVSRASGISHTTDHWFNVGATGGLFSKLSGNARVGYQLRQVKAAVNEQFEHFNATAGVAWPLSRKLSLGFQANRDFSTIATGASVDSISLSARTTYAYTRKIDFNTTIAAGRNAFLGVAQNNRKDTFLQWDVSAGYRMNQHLQFGASYAYFHNWSSTSLSDFESHGLTFDISSRY
jgi:hypothetical protein